MKQKRIEFMKISTFLSVTQQIKISKYPDNVNKTTKALSNGYIENSATKIREHS